jgi:hypothetical protein
MILQAAIRFVKFRHGVHVYRDVVQVLWRPLFTTGVTVEEHEAVPVTRTKHITPRGAATSHRLEQRKAQDPTIELDRCFHVIGPQCGVVDAGYLKHGDLLY